MELRVRVEHQDLRALQVVVELMVLLVREVLREVQVRRGQWVPQVLVVLRVQVVLQEVVV
jgi:hypothetical protein